MEFTLIDLLMLCVGLIIGFFIRNFFPTYFGEKGKNLATKEDIEEITLKAEKARQLQDRKLKKALVLEEYLALFARLIELYRFYAHREGHIEVDVEGNEFLIENFVVPDPVMAEAFEAIEETSIRAAIDQIKVDIRMSSGASSDIMMEFDPSDNLRKMFAEMFGELWTLCDFAIKHKNFDTLVSHLKTASDLRREIYLKIQEYHLDLQD